MIKSKFFAVLALTALLTGCGTCSETKTAAVKDSGTHFAADAVKPYIDSGECPGAISVFYKNGVQETACLGYADVEKQIPMSLDRTFMQCSQTKGFCGVTVAILIEEGKISLDDPVAKYLPEFKTLYVAQKGEDGKITRVPAKNVPTIRMVMNHTAGFVTNIRSMNKKGWGSLPLRDAAREAAADTLLFEPGTKVKYSNAGIDIGAAVVEVVTGKPWDVFLKERVLDPLGMTDTVFNPSEEQLSRAMSLYHVAPGRKARFRAGLKIMPNPLRGPHIHPSAAGGLWTTVPDQLKFYKMLMNLGVGDNGVRILKEETVRDLLGVSTRPPKFRGYSLGLNNDFKQGTIWHRGACKTYCQVNWRKKELKLWVVQQCHSRKMKMPWVPAWHAAADRFFAAVEK